MTRRIQRHSVVTLGALMALLAAPQTTRADTRPLDVERSSLTVLVYKSGLFSAFADNHVVRAPIATGSVGEDTPLGVTLTVRAAELQVMDPGLSAERRADIRTRMAGAGVLDVAAFPEITFVSTTVEPAGAGRWEVTGQLTLHGRTRTIRFPVAYTNGRYRGSVRLKQRDFGIEPIRLAGGTVAVKDEVQVQFEIAR